MLNNLEIAVQIIIKTYKQVQERDTEQAAKKKEAEELKSGEKKVEK